MLLYFVAGALVFVIAAFFLINAFYSFKTKDKFKDYQGQIAKSHSRILKLELANQQLEKRLKAMEAHNEAPQSKIA
jgi:hypothetical protein